MNYLLTANYSYCSISSETKTIGSSSSSNTYDEHDVENTIMGSSTACLVSFNNINSKKRSDFHQLVDTGTDMILSNNESHDSPHSEEQMLSIHSKYTSKTSNDNTQENMSLNGALISSQEKVSEYGEQKGSITEPNASPPSSLSSKNGTSGRRSAANLTVTFDFDYEDRSIGNDISDTPRSHIFKEVPSFLQNRIFGPVVDMVATKRRERTKQQSTHKIEPNKPNQYNHPILAKTRKGVDVIRKKAMAPQPPSLVAKTNAAV